MWLQFCNCGRGSDNLLRNKLFWLVTSFSLIVLLASLPPYAIAAGDGTAVAQPYPSKSAYATGQQLASAVIAKYREQGSWPEKICAMVWGRDASGREGPMVSFVLSLLGIRPLWDSQGNVSGLELIPSEKLGRPRLDATVITTGQFRDLYREQIILMDQAFRMALAASYLTIINTDPGVRSALDATLEDLESFGALVKGNEPLTQNQVAENWLKAVESNLASGMSAQEGGEQAITRIFAPRQNCFGSGISCDTPEKDPNKLAEQFQSKVGYSYSAKKWGEKATDLLRIRLKGTSLLFHCHSNRDSTGGVFDQDGSPLEYTYLLGLSAILETLNGKQSQMYMGDWSGGGGQLSDEGDQPYNDGKNGVGAGGTGSGLVGAADAVSKSDGNEHALDGQQNASSNAKAPKANYQYLGEKGINAAPARGGKTNSSLSGGGSWQAFEVSASTATGSRGANKTDIFTSAMIMILFLSGSINEFKKYVREVAR